MQTGNIARVSLWILLFGVGGASTAADDAFFIALGDLPGGAVDSHATGVSADGLAVTGRSISASGREAFRWTSVGGMVGLGDLPGGGFDSRGAGISGDGLVVVGVGLNTSDFEAFRWTAAGGMVGLGDLPGGQFSSKAAGASTDGSVVVGRSSSAAYSLEAYRWTDAGGMVGLGVLPDGFSSIASGVSADGLVVVGSSNIFLMGKNTTEAFRWSLPSAEMVGLSDLPGGDFVSHAHGVSGDGLVVVGESMSASGPEAFRWTEAGGMVGFGGLARRMVSQQSVCCLGGRVGGGGNRIGFLSGGSFHMGLYTWDAQHTHLAR